jgi:BON domain-containing protein
VTVYSQPMQTTMSTLSGRLKEFVNVGQNGRAVEEPSVATPALNDEVIDAKPQPEFPLPFSAPAGDTYPDKRVINEGPKESVIERKSSISAAEEHAGKRKRVSDQSNTVRSASIRPTSTEPPSNEKLEAEIHRAISNRAIQGVAVSVSDGTAYLGGRVASVRQKIVAARAAGSVAGIKNIENRIAVGPE